MGDHQGISIGEVTDERGELAAQAIALLETTFDPRDRHGPDELRLEIAEKRLGLIAPFDFHLLVASEGGVVLGLAIGVYLAGVNAGFVNYLAVAESRRGHGIGRLLRPDLVRRFREDARRAGHADLTWVLGEVRATNPWLRQLVRNRAALPFDFSYFHPGMRPGHAPYAYVLYRQPVMDIRVDLPAELVRRTLYAIYRRAYRVRYPLQHDGFRAMLDQLDGRTTVGPHPDFEYAHVG